MSEQVKFEHLGRPTVEQVERVWNDHPAPSARKVCEMLNQRGFKISWRSVLRWKNNGWASAPDGGGVKTIAEDQHTPAPVKQHIRAELGKLDPATVHEANQTAAAGGLVEAIAGGGLKDDDITRIAKRITELSGETRAALLEKQETARIVMNIVLMEEATRRAHVMTLIPKDTSAFVESFTDASKALPPMAPIEPVEPARNGDNARLIEGTATEMSPLSQAIRAVREKALA